MSRISYYLNLLCLFAACWTCSLAAQEGNLDPFPPKIIAARNPNSKPVSWTDLRSFLEADTADQGTYKAHEYDCKNFSFELFKHAQAKGIACLVNLISFSESNEGHALLEFPTSDQGTVFVDFTPIVTDEKQTPTKALVMVAQGRKFIRVPLSQVPSDFSNGIEFFDHYYETQEKLAKAVALIHEFQSTHQDVSVAEKVKTAYLALKAYPQSPFDWSGEFTVSRIYRW